MYERIERLYATLRAWRRDTAGTSMVTTAVTLPMFIVILFGIFGLFRVMSVKWVFDRGTREAARYLSEEGRFWNFEQGFGGTAGVTNTIIPANYYDIEAKRIILSRLRDVFNDKTVYDVITQTLHVTVTEPILAQVPGATPDPDYVPVGQIEKLCDPPGRFRSTEPGEFRHYHNIRFRVYAEMDMPVVWLPFIPYTDTIKMKFRNRAIGYVQCARWSGKRDASGTNKVEIYSREGPAVPYRNMATPWFPTVTPAPSATATSTVTPTITTP